MDLLEELLAEREIRQLLAQYPQYADDNDCEAWVGLFADNGAIVLGTKRIEGHEALRKWLITVQSGSRMRHLMMNPNISIESPTTARVAMDMGLLRAEGARWALVSAPRYDDRLVKTASGWKFLERVIDQRAP